MHSEEEYSDDAAEFISRTETQPLEERIRIRERYEELISRTQKEKEKDNISIEKINKNLQQGDELFKDVYRTREAVYDAKFMTSSGELIKMKARSLRVGTEFNPSSFLRKLAADLVGKDTNADVLPLDEEDWMNFGKNVIPMFKIVPTLNICHGTFPEVTNIPRPQRRARVKTIETKETEPVLFDPKTMQASTDKTCDEIQRIKKILLRLHRQRGRKPICYFKFIVDPHSFPRTIENIFHLSFLVKEQEVMLRKDSRGLPVIEPVQSSSRRGQDKSITDSQSILVMSVEKWKKIIGAFKIKEAIIPPADNDDDDDD